LDLGSFDITGVGLIGSKTLNGLDAELAILNPIIGNNQEKVFNIGDVVQGVETNINGSVIVTQSIINDAVNLSTVSSNIYSAGINFYGAAKNLSASQFYGEVDMKSNNIVNVGSFDTNLGDFIFNTETAQSNAEGFIVDLQTKTQKHYCYCWKHCY